MNEAAGGLLHLVVGAPRPDAGEADRERALRLARGLAAAEGAMACVAGRGEEAIAAAVWLGDRERLEAFASAPEHMRFVIEGMGRASGGMWSASIALAPDAPPPPAAAPRALWAFALPADPPAFEWEARELLGRVETLAAAEGLDAWAGPTVEERERFRAGGLVLAARGDAAALARRAEAARASWGPLAARLVTAAAPVSW